jgi:hypothetical protein
MLGCLLLAMPAIANIWYIARFGVNVPYEDSWNGTLPVVRAVSSGKLTFALLNAPHNENRMLFPNLIQAFLDSHTAANAKVDMYLSTIFVTAALILLVHLARRTTGLPILLLVPLSFLLFDWVQVENILWAFQLAWMMIVFCLIAALVGLDHRNNLIWFGIACAAGAVASYSSLQGLLVWPVGLIFASLTGWRRSWLGVWIGAGAVATGAYLWDFPGLGASSGLGYDLQHPGATCFYLIRLVGGISPTSHHLLSGAAILTLGALLGLVAYRRQVSVRLLRLPVALWCMGVLFDLLVALGRTQLAVPDDSRYTTFNLLLAAGLYLSALVLLTPTMPFHWSTVKGQLRRRTPESVVSGLAIAAVVLVLVVAIPSGLQQGRTYYESREHSAEILRHYRTTSSAKLANGLFAPSGSYIKVWARWLQSKRWSVFD